MSAPQPPRPEGPAVVHVTWDVCKADWRVTEEGRAPTLARTEEKEDAVARGRALLGREGGRVIVHRPDGSLEREVDVPGDLTSPPGGDARTFGTS